MTPDSGTRRHLFDIFWLSFAILFLELALIRYVPSYFRMLSFFSNFVLLSCFFGLSLGMLRHGGRNFFLCSLPLAATVVGWVTWVRPGTDVNFRQGDILFFGSEFLGESQRNLPFMVVLPLIFLVFGSIFFGLGQELMRRLRAVPSLPGYSANLWGSLVGSAAYTCMSTLGFHPCVWFSLVGLSLYPLWPRSSRSSAVFLLASLGLALAPALDQTSTWSPYSRVEYRPVDATSSHIFINGVSHQQMFPAGRESAYAIPYLAFHAARHRAPDVVIVGAGSGNDVSAALASGANSVQAVEIDPVINGFGRKYHPLQPYSDPRVRIHIMDGRRYIRTARDKVDIVAFGLVDSLTLLSGFGSTRLENNLFTQDSFQDARELLKDQGMLVVYNDFRESWLIARYYHQLANLFGADRVMLLTIPVRPTLSVRDGSVGEATGILIAGAIEPIRAWLRTQNGLTETRFDDSWKEVRPASDNWPFPYLREARIPVHNFWSAVLLLGLSLISLKWALGSNLQRVQWKMFWLGAGFMLIETRGIGRMSLLFGTSWQASSLSILAVLLLALIANKVSERYDLRAHQRWIIVGLLVCLSLDAIIPVASLLELPTGLRLAAAAAILFSPMFSSGLLFSQALRTQENAAAGLGSNLLGAMVGGIAENLTTVLGMQGLLALAAVSYLVAYRAR